MEELTEQQLRDQLETNLFGPLWVAQAALPFLREQRVPRPRGGRIRIKVTIIEPGGYATGANADAVRAEADPRYDGLRESFPRRRDLAPTQSLVKDSRVLRRPTLSPDAAHVSRNCFS